MIAAQPIIEKLRAAGFGNVEGVLQFSALTDVPRALPALFVVPGGERAAPNRLSGVIDQRVVASLAVVIVVGAMARAQATAADELEAAEARVLEALVGWKHPEASGPFEYEGGQLTFADARAVAWSVGITAPYHLRR